MLASTSRAGQPALSPVDRTDPIQEFEQAIHDYRVRSGRMFPTWSEVLEVLRSLGYEKPGAVA